MEALIALVILVLLAIPVLIILLLVGQARLRRRVTELEMQIVTLRQRPGARPPVPAQAPRPAVAEDQKRAEEKAEKPEPATADEAAQPETPEVKTAPDPIPDQKAPPKAVVFRQDRFAALGAWLRDNWFYAVSALSLALAGIFLVQYGVEHGMLPPTARVAAALGFGALLIVAGEVLRRRFGDDESSSTAYLPSVFSGAGLVTLFGAVLAARQLYDLLGPEGALISLMVVAALGLVLGWFHGPLLAAVGLIGAFAAPFLVGGASDDPSWLFIYFLIVAVLGLGIDTVHRWAWISVLTLIGAYGAGWLVGQSGPSPEVWLMVYVTALAGLAIMIPLRRLLPDHAGAAMSGMLLLMRGAAWPDFPTRLAFASVVISAVIVSLHWAASTTEFWLAVLLLSGMTAALIVWARGAPALQDVTLFPALGLLWVVFLHGFDGGPAYSAFAATYAETPEADYPVIVTALVAIGAMISLLSAWRAFQPGAWPVFWAAGAALFAPAMAIVLEVAWQPADIIGAYPWALHALALGAGMVLLAGRFARVDGKDRLRPALATLSALACLTFACVIVLSSGALTLAFAVMVAAAAALDRKFNLPLMSWFIWPGVLTLTFRLVLDPGLGWALNAPVIEMVLVYGGVLAAFLAAFWLVKPLARPVAKLVLESGAWAVAGILGSLLLLRWLRSYGEGGAQNSHWGMALLAIIWFVLAFAQVRRLELGGPFQIARKALAVFFGLHGIVLMAGALTLANPLIGPGAKPVLGPPVINTLAVAYLLPALVIGWAAWRIPPMPGWLRNTCFAVAGALAALWLGLDIRHFWQGAAGMAEYHGVSQPELYTYTIALLVIGAVLFYQSLARRSDLMRKAGLGVIGLAVAKVFLIDISGLGGLIRVFSLLALGLALAGLAWLNRWAKLRHAAPDPEPLDQ